MGAVIASCFVPVPAVSNANRSHEHWRKQKERADAQKQHTFAILRQMPLENHDAVVWSKGLLVRLIIVSAHALDDDNMNGAVKYYRDEVARWLGVDDGDPSVRYVAKWERYRGKGQRGVRIEFVRFLDHLIEEKARIEAEIGRQALQEEPFLVDDVARLGGRTMRQKPADFDPGDLRLAAVASEHAARGREFSPQVGVPGLRRVTQDLQRLPPATVQNQAA